MPEYLDDPSVLTKDKLKNELLANNVELPSSNATKDVYVQLYLKNLTAQNTKTVSTLDGFSSDEDLPPPVVSSRSRSSGGRKAIKKTDKVQSEALDVADLTAEGLKDELLKYGVDAGPIVASTRRVYEKKLMRLQEEGVSVAPPDLPPAQTETETNHNGHTDLDQFSDKEDEETRVIPEPQPEVIPEPEPLPEPIPLVERLVRSRGKTPVTTRTRSSQHNKTSDASEDSEVLNVKRPKRRTSYRVEPVHKLSCQTIGPNNVSPVLGDEPESPPLVGQGRTDLVCSPSPSTQGSSDQSAAWRDNSVVLKAPSKQKTPNAKPTEVPWSPQQVEKVVVVQTPRVEERDVLKEVFANDLNSPTGIIASCRKPIRGAAGRPIPPSDFWKDENLLLSPKSLSTTTSTTSTYTETRHRSPNLLLSTPPSTSSSASRLLSTAPPAVQTREARRGFSIWLKLFLLVLLAAFLFFVYQTMEADALSPFSHAETEQTATEGMA